MQEIRWGIIGCGDIARTFAASLQAVGRGMLLAGASRTPGKARAFAEEYALERIYTDYEALASDPDLDAVYVATTHNFHFENVRLCLEHGKHVLCEKPFTLNAAQARALSDLAQARKLFLMEALWTRFLPAIEALCGLLEQRIIGDIQTVYVNFCLGKALPPEHRLRNIDLAGGALLDLGIYPISMADIVFRERPVRIRSAASMDRITGVDEHSYYFFEYSGGRQAVLSASASQAAPVEALVCGTEGFIRVPHFLGAQELHIHRKDHPPEVRSYSFGEGENFRFEIEHAMDCIQTGRTESDVMPLSKTIEIMEIMDTLRREWGLAYPGETP